MKKSNNKEEIPPFGRTWNLSYLLVILALLAQIVFFWFFTNTFS
jgi:hypothetical protein